MSLFSICWKGFISVWLHFLPFRVFLLLDPSQGSITELKTHLFARGLCKKNSPSIITSKLVSVIKSLNFACVKLDSCWKRLLSYAWKTQRIIDSVGCFDRFKPSYIIFCVNTFTSLGFSISLSYYFNDWFDLKVILYIASWLSSSGSSLSRRVMFLSKLG